MKTIKDYIEFAIENGFNDSLLDLDFLINRGYNKVPKISHGGEIEPGFIFETATNIITSKEFIEAVARGKMKDDTYKKYILEVHCNHLIDTLSKMNKEDVLKELTRKAEDWITRQQAIAIRDNKLEEFINNLGIGKS